MTICECDSRHAALQAAHAALPMIGPALIADSGEWTAVHTGGGNFAWALDTFDREARILIVDDDGGLGDERSEAFSVFLDSECGTSEWSADAATMPDAVTLAGMIHAARAFALGFRPGAMWDDAHAASADAALRVAAKFRTVLHEWLGDDGMARIRRENVANVGSNVCASHNQCDANMAMDEAFRRVFGAGPLDGMEHMSDAACDLWGAAWDIAKDNYLTGPDDAAASQDDALAALSAELAAYASEHGLALASADEMALDYPDHAEWLLAFVDRWDAESDAWLQRRAAVRS